MADILLLVHRVPYPPDKGDKVRSYHLLRHLASDHRVFLATFADDPGDIAHGDVLRQWCGELHIEPLDPGMAKLASLRGLLTGEALSLPYYRSVRLAAWVASLAGRVRFDAVIVFSSVMAQYVPEDFDRALLVDFVDVDSAKWTQYADRHPWPMSWLYRREGQRLLAYERRVAQRATRSFFVTDAEVELFRRLAPDCERVEAVGNGVDSTFFAPDPNLEKPFADDEIPVVFTGAMDYWPNVDAVTWFAAEVMPKLVARHPRVRFHIVGRSPAPAVQALASETVSVSGSVPDVRPYLQHAAVVVAPLRVARGVQNKILEAMSMGKVVVAARACAAGIEARTGEAFHEATDPEEYVAKVAHVIDNPLVHESIGRSAREAVLARYSWEARLAAFDARLRTGLPHAREAA